jgi:preprotein translocase subunit YajC
MPSSGIGNLILFSLPVLLLLYLFMISRRGQRQTQAFQRSLSVGDDVVTTSGMFGRIVAIDDGVVALEVAPGTTLRFDRRAIGMAAPAGGPTAHPGTES